ncbi:hypothetical protein M9978_02175 [Sphingomonas sp. MG17]|uniref:Uncharacterized protein n=1 Tax=Sphingomonas tagetis TaxID=2949092 RepID=A0A9X2KN27_9SPHN|nr:hypothetical protein [Sphingomonas tagetis]MCP3729223.1 hypothetical protein [Sphingomonas tagetis]
MLAFLTLMAMLASAPVQDRDFDPERCRVPADRGVVVLAARSAPKVKAGETVAMKPIYTTNPGALDELPVKCFSGWTVSDPKLARLSSDRKTIAVAAAARAGSKFTVSAMFRGKRISETYEVIVPVASPLVGFWTQEGVDACAEPTRLFDLVFERSGDFAVALGPRFHGSKDYHGKWRVEGDRLILTEVTGSKPADFAAEAKFTIDANGGLSFDQPWFGTQGERGKCAAPFRKMR